VRLISGSWTEAYNERLKAFVEQGASIVRAAAALNRSIIISATKLEKSGHHSPPRCSAGLAYSSPCRSCFSTSTFRVTGPKSHLSSSGGVYLNIVLTAYQNDWPSRC
jgi:hypothetical protein